MATCEHFQRLPAPEPTERTRGCEECLKIGQKWVHLRKCLICGHVGCCDQSIGKHATAHFHETKHPVISSAEPGERWKYCYVDDTYA
jgi:uncharacterized UBP type Zn finger protein